MISEKLPKIFYGGDYNPDQWPEEIWYEDMRLSKKAGVNIVTLPVFSWAKLQPSEDTYNFEWLDKVLDLVAENGIYACLATPTAAQPAWMSLRYPEVLRTDEDGRKRSHGKRLNYCPNSIVYHKFSAEISRKMAERYKDHKALAVWHISNEYVEGGYCYCENCAKEFRIWLKKVESDTSIQGFLSLKEVDENDKECYSKKEKVAIEQNAEYYIENKI